MKKLKKRFKISCYVLAAYAILSLSEIIVFFARGVDVAKMYPDFPDTESGIMVLTVAVIVACVISTVLHLWLSALGLSKIKKEKTGKLHFVLEFILSIAAFSALYNAIGGFSNTGDTFFAVFSVVMAALRICALLLYDWFAINFQLECKKKA